MNQQAQGYIHPEAQIGANVTISPFCYIDKNVVIGEGTWIGPNVTIFEGARIGADCKIFPGAVISGIPQDLKFDGETTTAEIGDRTTIREYVTINRGTTYAGTTKVGSDCLLMAYVHVAHDCIIGDRVILANNVNLA
ncbi:MAG: acyl-[acyl-carrier-protein]--UDP-N-acetylglucosamine O-acyltransferase, partial [Saprospiraceae bacterium]|nr:acyl-[acyl-carrier-protein]--UDP-N-acetylglucosamine O-acyltransferase [Saprospiraceae bacterium]